MDDTAAAEAAVEAYRALSGGGAGDSVELAYWLRELAALLFARGESERALAALNESVAGYRVHAVRDSTLVPELARVLTDLAYMRFQGSDAQGAREAAEEAVAAYRALGEAHWVDLALAYNNLANCLSRLADPQAALRSQFQAVEVIRPLLGTHPEEAAMLLRNLASCLVDAGRSEEASQYLDAAAAAHEAARRDGEGVGRAINTALTRDSVASAFPEDDVTAVPLDDLPSGLSDPVARRVLTEVGLPEDVVGCLFFTCAAEPMLTLQEFRRSEPVLPEVAGDYLVAITDRDVICLDGNTGRCRFVPRGLDAPAHAARNLEALLAFLCALRIALHNISADPPEAELDRVEERLICQYRAADSEIAEANWRWIIRRCIGEVLI